jgi:hypothetical protein
LPKYMVRVLLLKQPRPWDQGQFYH